jgi:hypothetical protein
MTLDHIDSEFRETRMYVFGLGDLRRRLTRAGRREGHPRGRTLAIDVVRENDNLVLRVDIPRTPAEVKASRGSRSSASACLCRLSPAQLARRHNRRIWMNSRQHQLRAGGTCDRRAQDGGVATLRIAVDADRDPRGGSGMRVGGP